VAGVAWADARAPRLPSIVDAPHAVQADPPMSNSYAIL
jgi:hypothetical protein